MIPRRQFMKVTLDKEAGAGYVYLTEIKAGEAVETVEVDGKQILLDFDKKGRLLGIEFLNTKRMHPTLLRQVRK